MCVNHKHTLAMITPLTAALSSISTDTEVGSLPLNTAWDKMNEWINEWMNEWESERPKCAYIYTCTVFIIIIIILL